MAAVINIVAPLLVSGLVIGYAGVLPAAINAKLAENSFGTRTASHANMLREQVDAGYAREAMNRSIDQASFDTAADGGNVDWSDSSFPPDVEDVKRDVTAGVEDTYDLYFRLSPTNSICDIEPGSHEVSVSDTQATVDGVPGVRFAIATDEPAAVNCSTAKQTTVSTVPTPRNWFSAGNRLFLMFQDMKTEVEAVKDAWPSVSEKSGTGSDCGSRSDAVSEAKEDARGDVESALQSELDSAVGSGTENGFSVTEKDLDSFSVSYNDVSSSESGDCDCEYDEEGELIEGSCDTDYDADADAEPTSASADIEIEDEDYRVRTDDGDVHMVFEVTYDHSSFD